MSCCGGGQVGGNSCCNGRNINDFGRCSSGIAGMAEATLNTIITEVCQKKYRMQDACAVKCGPRRCQVDPCCPLKRIVLPVPMSPNCECRKCVYFVRCAPYRLYPKRPCGC